MRTDQRSKVLIDVASLMNALERPPPPVLLDIRWSLGDPQGREHYQGGHLPDAVFVDLETELAAAADPVGGRHPLPELADLQAAARRWGISEDTPVVVYDATGGLAAARAWWLLRWAGHEPVRLLDGGLAAWEAAGGPVAAGPGAPPALGDVTLTGHAMPTVIGDAVLDLAVDGVLLDARAVQRYRGEVEPIDARAGHIPGAISAPTTGNLAPDGRFLAPGRLAERFTALGVSPATRVGVYCGSGVTAAHEIAALATIGIDAALYPGSWSAWSADSEHRVETGDGRRRPGGQPRPAGQPRAGGQRRAGPGTTGR